MGQPTTQVDTASLAKVGASMEEDAAAFVKAHASRAAELAGAGALAGWSSGAAMARATQTWGAFLKQLTGEVQSTGAGLARSAAEFRATDEAADGRISSAGHTSVRTIP